MRLAGRTKWGLRFRLLMGLPVSCLLLLASCGATPNKTAHASRPVRLAQIVHMHPRNTSVTLLPGSPAQLSSLDFVNAQDGWSGGRGIILATSNGGASWRRQYLGPGAVTGFSFLSPTMGFAATSAGLLRTVDGRTWHRVDRVPLQKVQFFSATRGIALETSPHYASSFRLLATSDGGTSWSPIAVGRVLHACFFGPRVGIAAMPFNTGMTIRLKRTTDGGASWSTVLTVGEATPAQLECTKDGGAWLVAGGQAGMSQQSYSVFRSTDEGADWQVVLGGTTGDGPGPGNSSGAPQGPVSMGLLSAVSSRVAVMQGICTACGYGTQDFSATTDGGVSWTPITHPTALPGDNSVAFEMVSADVGWMLSTPGPGESEIQMTTDGGASWRTELRLGPSTPLSITAFVSDRIGFGILEGSGTVAVMRTQDGGQHWNRVGELPQAPVGIFAWRSGRRTTLLAPTANHAIYISTNGGRTWAARRSKGLPTFFTAMSFATPTDGCTSVAGPQSTTDYVTKDGGRTWHLSPKTGAPAAVCAISLVNPALSRAATYLINQLGGATYNLAMVATGGGTLWIAYSNAPHSTLYILAPGRAQQAVLWPDNELNINYLSPVSASEAYILTYSGRLLSTRDAGGHWTQVR